MIKNRIKRVKDSILQSMNISSEIVYLRDIIKSDMEDTYKQFLSAEVRWWIYEDRLLRSANKSFDFTGMNHDEINEQIDNIYWENARFELSEFEELIKKAVRYRLNYLCRPKYTLMKFIFADQPTRLYNEVELKLNYFSDYQYLINGIINSLLDDREYPDDEKIINRNRFENIIESIEEQMAQKLDFNGFNKLVLRLTNFFSDKDPVYSKVPLEILILFLRERKLNKISEQLMDYSRQGEIENLTPEQINEFLNTLVEVHISDPN